MITNSKIDPQRNNPWYSQGWPWFIFCFPAISVILGCGMLYLGYHTNNSLVVDDYYKQGKSLSQYAERDNLATRLRLVAEISSSDEGTRVNLSQLPEALEVLQLPEILSLRWVHVTQSHKDGYLSLQASGSGGFFKSDVTLPIAENWRLHVEPSMMLVNDRPVIDESGWRLVSDRVNLATERNTTVSYRD